MFILLDGITVVQAIPPIARYTFLHSMFCLFVVCHIRAPCLHCSTDLDAMWPLVGSSNTLVDFLMRLIALVRQMSHRSCHTCDS